MLADPPIRDHFEMMDDQYETLKQLNDRIRGEWAKQLRGSEVKDVSVLADQIES